ncbi:hypothetical protein [Streptomyces sannanensis]|uniref:hypothetical protein n=1 Tax=Streptomyces sannanensis TaxID=285536 RepID=UPI0031E798DB
MTQKLGTFRVSGRWDYVSGICHAKWVLVHCEDGASGRTIGVALPADVLRIDRTWRVMGLEGTGSHTVVADGIVIRPEQVYALDEFADSSILTRHHHLPQRMAFALHIAAVCLGLASGAMNDLGSVRNPHADHLGSLAAQLMMAESAFERTCDKVWFGEGENDWRETEVAGLARAICQTALSVTQGVFSLAGSRANFTASPVQRRLRDVLAASSHANVDARRFATLGEALIRRRGVT